MSYQDEISNRYFEWIVDMVSTNRFGGSVSYRKLLMHLHRVEFIFSMPMDENRAYDGLDLRYRFALETGIMDAEDYLDSPCSVLEMIAGLALRCEENIMDDPQYGDRTGQWFWGMISNLGLGSMTDDRYDRAYVDFVIDRFLNREYEPNGRGGLFTVERSKKDLRRVEIWYQMCWYLDSIGV